MKNLAIILIAVLSISTLNLHAAEKSETATTTNSELILDTSTEYSAVKVATKVPNGLKSAVLSKLSKGANNCLSEGEVYMRICVDQDNYVKIVGMNATKPCLHKYVSKQLSSTYVKNPDCKPGQVYMMKVNFNIE